MMLIYSAGVSAVKYSGASRGSGGSSFKTTGSESFEVVWGVIGLPLGVARGLSREDVKSESVSVLPHCKR